MKKEDEIKEKSSKEEFDEWLEYMELMCNDSKNIIDRNIASSNSSNK